MMKFKSIFSLWICSSILIAEELSYMEFAQGVRFRKDPVIRQCDELIREAREAYNNQNYEKSVAYYKKAIIILPKKKTMITRRDHLINALFQGLVALGNSKFKSGDPDGARKAIGEAKQIAIFTASYNKNK